MVPIYSPTNEMELINLRSILHAADIPFFIQNDHFGSMAVGPRIEHYNAKTIRVPAGAAAEALGLVHDYVTEMRETSSRVPPWHVIRMILEVFLLGWIMPYRKPEPRR